MYLGAGNYGIDAAAHFYFDKSARELSLSESAVIAGLLKAPSKYAPTRQISVSQERANQVLQNIDDTNAETEYQLKSGDINLEEILIYLKQAQSSCRDWFDLIPKGDVEEAFNAVSTET